MADPAQAYQTQLANIEKRTGVSVADLVAAVRSEGALRHSDCIALLKQRYGMGHGDANAIAHLARSGDAPPATDAADPLEAIYTGAKAGLRPLHEAVIAATQALGPFESAPKKTYASLRRAKQFATVGPATKTQLELGFNLREAPASARIETLPPGKMCSHRIRLASLDEIDAEVRDWLALAWAAAG